jgi:hypothetical protein
VSAFEEELTFDDPVPTTVLDWIHEQSKDPDFLASLGSLESVACRNGLYLHAPDNCFPRIFVPPNAREPLIRATHVRMFHLGYAQVTERLL